MIPRMHLPLTSQSKCGSEAGQLAGCTAARSLASAVNDNPPLCSSLYVRAAQYETPLYELCDVILGYL